MTCCQCTSINNTPEKKWEKKVLLTIHFAENEFCIRIDCMTTVN